MANLISWRRGIDDISDSAPHEQKPLFLHFFDLGCFFSQKMDTVTYSRSDVIQLLNQHFIPCRITPETPNLFRAHAVHATPVQITLCNEGFERQRSTGFLNGPELMAFLLLALGKHYFDNGRLDEALEMVGRLVSHYGESRLLPEAIFHQGFFLFKKTGERRYLREAHAMLQHRCPDSSWTQSAKMVSMHYYAPALWEWSQKKSNIINCRFWVHTIPPGKGIEQK